MIQRTFCRVVTGLDLVILSKYGRSQDRFNGYKYLIRSHGCTPFSAFRTKSGLRHWLDNTGLKVGECYDRRFLFRSRHFKLIGQYIDNCTIDEEGFEQAELSGSYKKTVVLSNAEYITGLVETTEEGNVIHYMNCNYKRTMYNYLEMKKVYG